VTFRFIQSEADLVAYNLLFLGQSRTHQRAIWLGRLILPGFAIAIAAYTLLLRPERLPGTVLLSILAILWFLFWPTYRRSSVAKVIKRLMQERSNASILGEHVVTIDDRTIHCVYPAGTSEVRWANIVDLREDERLLLLYISSIHVLIFPKDRVDSAILSRLKEQARQAMAQQPHTAG
jgi:YcxB-like protein